MKIAIFIARLFYVSSVLIGGTKIDAYALVAAGTNLLKNK